MDRLNKFRLIAMGFAIGWTICGVCVIVWDAVADRPVWMDKQAMIVTHGEKHYRLVPMKLVDGD